MSIPQENEEQVQENHFLIDNIRTLLHQKPTNEAKFCRATGIPQPTLHKILSGKTADPRLSTLKTIARYFQVTLDELCAPSLSAQGGKISLNSVPILSWENCIQLPSLRLESYAQQRITLDIADTKGIFGLVTKPSMEPFFNQGTLLLIDSKRIPSDGNLVIVHYTNCNEATLRRLLSNGPDRELLSVGGTPKSDPVDQNISILGVVIQSRYDYVPL